MMKGSELDRHETGGMNCAESTVAANEYVAPLDLDGIYRVHAPDVMHWIARLAGPHSDIEDMVHEVFMVVQRRLHEFRGDAKITTWLYRITERIVFDRRRKDRKLRWLGLHRAEETGRALNSSTTSPVESIERQQSVALVYRILDTMDEKYRSVLILFEMESMSGEDVAKLTGMKLATIWVRLRRARAQFLRELERIERRDAQ
jgi:RNA polymerase sigma-70 factor (ECF subfamily)